MTIRSFFGNVLSCLGTSLFILSLVIAMQHYASAGLCTGCVGCSGSTVYNPDGTISCPGNCTQGGIIWSCDPECICRANANKSGCNCQP